MSDIIERLRASEAANVLTNEAANEILQLRIAIQSLRQQRAVLIHQVTNDGQTVAYANSLVAKIKNMHAKF